LGPSTQHFLDVACCAPSSIALGASARANPSSSANVLLPAFAVVSILFGLGLHEVVHALSKLQESAVGRSFSTYVFALPDGRQVKGSDLQQHKDWPWRHSPQVPGVRYARLRATSPTYGAVTIIIVDASRDAQFYVMCLDTAISGPRLIRAWKRRSWIEHCFRTLKHLLAAGACQVHSEDAYYGHLVIRLMGCLVLFYTSRVICKGRLTMEEIIFSLKHYWRFVDCEALELTALSQGVDETAA